MNFQHTRRRPPGGFTLRELSIALTIGSIVMMTAISLLHHAFDWSTTARHRRLDDQTFFNFSRQFRSDVHLANEVSISNPDDDSAGTLNLTIDGGNQVVYRIAEQSISRIESADSKTVRGERYRWKRPRQIRFDRVDSEDQIRVDVKSVTPFDEPDVPLWRSLRVSIGLRLRHRSGDIAS